MKSPGISLLTFLATLAMGISLSANTQASSNQATELSRAQVRWSVAYPELVKGQSGAREDWAHSRKRAAALKSLQRTTRELNNLFLRYSESPIQAYGQAVLDGVTRYCHSVSQVIRHRGAFSEVSYVMHLSSSEAIAEMLRVNLSAPSVSHACSF
jgi:hypothetical protein